MPQSLLPAAELALRWLMQSAWQAGLLAAGVLAITWLCGSWLEPRWRFALWLVVFVRLALPMAPASPWSVFGLMHFRIAERSVDPSNSFAAVAAPAAWRHFARPTHGSADDHGGAVEMPAPRVGKANELTMDDPRPPRARMASPLQAAALIWLAGVVALAFRWLASVWRLSRQQRQWQLVTDSGVLALLESCCRELPLRRTVSLYLTPEKIGPATCGVIRPRIVLPERLLTALSHGELRLVLLHELVHVRRHDVLIDQLASLVTIVHWFHPVAWLARYCLRRERELACDAAVLDRLQPHAAADYGHAILKTVESLSRPASSYGLVGMFSSGPLSLITRRIRRIADYRRTTRLSVALGGLFLVAFSLTGLTDAQPQPARSKLDARRRCCPSKRRPGRRRQT